MASAPSTPVLRVKRRRSQSPAGALLLHLSAKKRKNDDDESSPKKEAVFKFTATVDCTSHESLKTALEKSTPVKTDPRLLKRIIDRKDEKTTPKKSDKRYKFIAEKRGISDENEIEKESERLYRLVDVVKDGEEFPNTKSG